MARRRTRLAGCGTAKAVNFRFLPSTACIWDVLFAGSLSLVCLCVRATAECTTATVRAPRARRSAGLSNIRGSLRKARSLLRPVSCPHREEVPLLREGHRHAPEGHRHAPDLKDWWMVRPPTTPSGSHSGSRRTSHPTKIVQLVLRIWQRCIHGLPSTNRYRNSARADLRALRG